MVYRELEGGMKRNNVGVRLQQSVLDEAHRTEEYFRERSQRGNLKKAKQLLKHAGRGKPTVPGDKLK
jgi:hypothetical protein